MSGKAPIPTRDPQVYEGANVIVPIGGWQLIRSPRSPSSNDKKYPIGSIWVNTTTNAAYILTSAPGNWSLFGSSSGGAINSITGDTGGAELPVAGNFTIVGTANQVAVTGSAGTETLSLVGPYTPATYTAHGVLMGEGTSSIHASAAGTAGQVFTSGGASADGAYIGFTTPNGTLTITSNATTQGFDVLNGGQKVNIASTGGTLVIGNTYTVTQAAQTSFALPATAAVGSLITIASAAGNTSGWIITQAASQEIWAGTSHTTNGATGTLAGAIHTSVTILCVVANIEWVIVGGSGLTGLTFV